MSGDPMLSRAVAGALGEHRPPEAHPAPAFQPGSGGTPLLYARVVTLCRLLGYERFFRAAFSRARAARTGGPAGTPGPGAGQESWVVKLDVEEVLRDALGVREPAAPMVASPPARSREPAADTSAVSSSRRTM
ncbi:hypothetical protein GCM10022226_26530 [Sphaerisporangium flaviroseum]|uniref:Uncharacterized protein n=1 Tax=Sphaerisporangium flaviroseum TaxID=509199 RepID=A0ABP7HWF1_9ACTN